MDKKLIKDVRVMDIGNYFEDFTVSQMTTKFFLRIDEQLFQHLLVALVSPFIIKLDTIMRKASMGRLTVNLTFLATDNSFEVLKCATISEIVEDKCEMHCV